MAELPVKSSVALIEREGPNSAFFLERRLPNGEDFPHAGKVGFFGGCALEEEDPWQTILREVDGEELRIYVPKSRTLVWRQIETEQYEGSAWGQQILRSVTLFELSLPLGSRVRMNPRESMRSEVVMIPRTEEGVRSLGGVLTPYAENKLLQRIRGEGPWKGTAI